MKINVRAFKGPPERPLAPNDHQSGAKVVPQDPKMPPKWCPRPIKISSLECKSTLNQFSIIVSCDCKFASKNDNVLNFFNDFDPADLSNPVNKESMKSTSIVTATLRTHRLHSLMAPGNNSNPANPSILQITSQLVARGAGGRGEALRIRRTSSEVAGRAKLLIKSYA